MASGLKWTSVDRGFFRRHDRKGLGQLRRGALDEEAVDTRRALERFAQARGRLEVGQQGNRPELEIEVDEGCMLLVLLTEQPGQVDRQAAGADPATRSDDRDPLDFVGVRRFLHGRRVVDRFLRARQGRGEGFFGYRLDQVVGDPRADHLAVQVDVVDGADADQPGILGEGGGQREHGGQRRRGIADIHDDHLGRRKLGEVFQRLLAAAVGHHGRIEELRDHRFDDPVGLIVTHEGDAFGRVRGFLDLGFQESVSCAHRLQYPEGLRSR